ncbi:hypothetical protein Pmani_029741 [Petrolisthes manimaculis]|uniref:C2H2-type domain-containing protein n=1 Tax=Petrolisthes manimaculis TaxID=1843537 RepID=A0AAE1NXF6_9EUCA|nr:hypothetical protein Pmani_029741 [Petrolisthes manimaculis]
MWGSASSESPAVGKGTVGPGLVIGKGTSVSKDLVGATEQPPRRFGCDYCGKMFRRQYDVAQHRRRHTGNLPYSCHTCHKKFINRSHYNYHMTRSLEHRVNRAGGQAEGADDGGHNVAAEASDQVKVEVQAQAQADQQQPPQQQQQQPQQQQPQQQQQQQPQQQPQQQQPQQQPQQQQPQQQPQQQQPQQQPQPQAPPPPQQQQSQQQQQQQPPPQPPPPLPQQMQQAQQHPSRPQQPYMCIICNKFFSTRSHYSYHMLHSRGFSGGGGGFGGVGDEEDVVKVLVDKAFCLATPFSYLNPDSGSGQQQQQQQQAGFGCRVCGQVIQRRDNYRRHMRLHSGQLPFQCHLCPRRFNTRYHLHYHLYRSTVHPNEHPVKQPTPSPPPPPPPADDA